MAYRLKACSCHPLSNKMVPESVKKQTNKKTKTKTSKKQKQTKNKQTKNKNKTKETTPHLSYTTARTYCPELKMYGSVC